MVTLAQVPDCPGIVLALSVVEGIALSEVASKLARLSRDGAA